MTRWGILADIHGNLPALERALVGFQIRQVDRIVVLGDNLGRGDSDGCIKLVRQVADVSVVGNRDLDWQDRVGTAAREYVRSLPRVAIVDRLAFSHGDARLTRDLSSDDIRRDFRRAHDWLAANGCRVWLFGHTHRARIWTSGSGDVSPRLLFDAATEPLPTTVRLDPTADFWVVNSGSVGLPFPGKGPASATVFDTDADTVEVFPI